VALCPEPLLETILLMPSSASTKGDWLSAMGNKRLSPNGFLKQKPKKAVTCGLYSPEDSNCFLPFVMENICPS
jgi:hypothetical protein